MKLPNDMGTFDIIEQPSFSEELAVQAVKPLVIHLFSSGLFVKLTLTSKAFLGKGADYIGRALDVTFAQAPKHPFGMHLLLAFLAHHNHLPTDENILSLRLLVEMKPVIVHEDWMASQALEREITQSLAKTDDEVIWLPNGSWNLARSFFVLGAHLWQLRGEQAAFWGTSSSRPETLEKSSEQRVLFSYLAALVVSPDLLEKLPFPPDPDAHSTEIWLDAVSIASGPNRPHAGLRKQGLGVHGASPIENGAPHLGMIWEHAQVLEDIARFILLEIQHPTPRYLGHLLRMPLPSTIAAHLQKWGIDHFIFQVQENGLYVSVCDQTQRSLATAWWRATPESAWRVPLSFPPAAWTLLHPVLSAFWGDLCSDTIIVQRPDGLTHPLPPDTTPRKKVDKRQSSRTIYLPPVHIEPVQWTDDRDMETIHQITTRYWKGYRRLPRGWADRINRADFKRRQEAATKRANSHFYAAPSPGFTFVAPKGSAIVTHEDQTLLQIPRVKARGLQSLSLRGASNSF